MAVFYVLYIVSFFSIEISHGRCKITHTYIRTYMYFHGANCNILSTNELTIQESRLENTYVVFVTV